MPKEGNSEILNSDRGHMLFFERSFYPVSNSEILNRWKQNM